MALVTFLPIAPAGATMQTGSPRNLPFPMVGEYGENPATAPFTFYTLKVSLAKAVEYWWRVRVFKLTYSVGDLSGELSLARKDMLNPPLNIEEGEEQKICYPQNCEWSGSFEVGPSDNRISASVRLLTPDNPADANYYISHTEVVPALRIFIDAYFFSGDSKVVVKTYEAGPNASTITFDGETLDCIYENSFEPFDFAIEAASWFTYSGTWNSGTGAKN